MKRVLIFILYPFAEIYGFFVEVRGLLYDLNVFHSHRSACFSIGIGNITVGGTGKTPHIEYLIRKFKDKNIATLSRGYGRETHGFLTVNESMNATLAGDEPWQFFLKFGTFVKVTVGEKRVPAAEKIHTLYPEVDLLLMDDVFQHRAIQPDVMILLCDYNRPFFYDYPFPAGRLREFRKGAQRADAIIVSKCPDSLTPEERSSFIKKLNRYAPSVPVAFSKFSYGQVVAVTPSDRVPSRWLLVTGIAQAQPLVDYLQTQNSLMGHLEYADHHNFTKEESIKVLNTYQELAGKDTGVLLTEKDYARLSRLTRELWKEIPLYYIPIEVCFLEGEDFLLQKIRQAMNSKDVVKIN
ncbi:MAG: tetraacyldisaccharide 4-kinase [Chitinophagaceae bacterium]|nr:tetraacyldisaccharide 4-kinase [Chitinophagaceae bacterium]